MIYAALEIYSFKQLSRLNPGLLEEVKGWLTSLLETRGGRRVSTGEAGIFIHSFGADDAAESVRVIDSLVSLRDFLRKRGDELMGFGLFFERYRDTESREFVLRELKESLLRVEDDDQLTAGSAAAELFSGMAVLEPKGRFFRVVERASRSGGGTGAVKDPRVRDRVVKDIEEFLSSRFDCFGSPDILLVHGPSASGVRDNLYTALGSLVDETAILPVFPLSRHGAFYVPFVNSYRKGFFGDVSEHLSSAERSVFEEKKGILSFFAAGAGRSRTPDFPKREIGAVFSLLVTAFRRRCEEALSPAVMVCEDFHAFPADTRGILSGVFRECLPRFRVNLVCTSRLPFLGYEFRDFPVTRHLVSAMEPGEGEKTPDRAEGTELRPGLNLTVSAGEGRESRLVFKQEREFRETLYILSSAGPLLSAVRLGDFLEEIDVPRERTPEILRRCRDFGLIRDESMPALPLSGARFDPASDPDIRKGFIDEKLPAYLYKLWKKGSLEAEGELYRFFLERDLPRYALDVLRSLYAERIDSGDYSEARRLLYGAIPGEGEETDRTVAEWRDVLVLSGRLRLAMAEGERRTAAAVFEKLESCEFTTPLENPSWGEYLLQRARHLASTLDFKRALDGSKKAAIHLQDREGSAGAVRANVEIGLIMLAQENLENALDYFRIAHSAAANEGLVFERVRSGFFEAVIRFLQGNYSRVMEGCDALVHAAEGISSRRWRILVGFLKGRALFELGEYEEAETLFLTLLAECEALRYLPPAFVLRSWTARCHIYGGKIEEGLAFLEGLKESQEVLFFRAEGQAFAGNPREAVRLLSDFPSLGGETTCFLGDGFVWRDGFSVAENLLVGRGGGDTVLVRQAKALKSLQTAALGGFPQAAEEMHRFIKEEGYSEHDPYNRLYFYWYSRILPRTKDRNYEDRLTMLGLAVKFLNQSTGRIEEPAHKASFAAKNRWNRMLIEEARDMNLV